MSKRITFISEWLKAPPDVQQAVLEKARTIAAAAQSPALAIRRKLDRETQDVAETMREIHGGNWSITVDHDDRFVLIACDLCDGRAS